jgi:hypothetical protein
VSELRDAYELIRDPERWTTGSLARDANDVPVSALSACAVKWCVNGALVRCGATIQHRLLDWVVGQLFPGEARYSDCIMFANDQLGHEAVMQIFEKALVETEGGL